ncbi:SLC13 family permease, partial [Cellulomonas septica]|nr:HD domain-containing protein [Cellulomonas septica]
MSRRDVVVHPDATVLAEAVAARLLTRLLDLQSHRSPVHVVLTGGTVGIASLAAVARSPLRDAVDWSGVHLWWGDERFLPDGDADRNETQAREALLDGLDALPAANVHPMPAQSDDVPTPEASAAAYARTLAERTLPILLFLAALTVVAETSAGAGLFDAAAALAARAARGRRVVLWLLVVVLATLSTAVLSLDTTAVLLTPVVIALARHTRTSPLPFALAVLALANTASLVLPVSNLTNLLADHAIRRAGASFLPLMWAPALVAIVVTVAILAVRDRRHLDGTYEPQEPSPAPDRTLLLLAAGVTGLMAVGFVAGLSPAPLATGAAVLLLVATRVRRRPWPVPPSQLVPWRTLVVVLGLFVAVETAHAHGLGALLHDIGKGRQGDHSIVGADLATQIGNRLGLWPSDVRTLSAMVRHHLLLPDTATRRDLSDPETVRAVSEALDGDPQLLELLHTL